MICQGLYVQLVYLRVCKTNPQTLKLVCCLVTTHVYDSDSSCTRILRRNVQVFLAVAGEPKNIILTRATELAPPEGVAGRQERDAQGRGRTLFGVRSAAGASGEERIGVIFLGRWSSGSRADSEESEERFLALPGCGRQARNDDGVGMANWRPRDGQLRGRNDELSICTE